MAFRKKSFGALIPQDVMRNTPSPANPHKQKGRGLPRPFGSGDFLIVIFYASHSVWKNSPSGLSMRS